MNGSLALESIFGVKMESFLNKGGEADVLLLLIRLRQTLAEEEAHRWRLEREREPDSDHIQHHLLLTHPI